MKKTYREFMKEAYGNTDADFERKIGYDPRTDKERAIDKSWKTVDKPAKTKKKVSEAISSKGVNHQILSKHGFEAGAPGHYVHKSGQEVQLHGKTGWLSKPANRSAKGDSASKWAAGTRSTGLARHLKKNFPE